MTPEVSSYFMGAVCLSAAFGMNVVGLVEHRRSVLAYRGTGDFLGERMAKGHFNGQLAGTTMIALALSTCLWRLIEAIGPSPRWPGIVWSLIAITLLVVAIFQVAMLRKQRWLLRQPELISTAARGAILTLHGQTLIATAISLALFLGVVGSILFGLVPLV